MMRITLDVRLYEDVLYELHLAYVGYREEHLKLLIRRLEADAFEITWNLWRRP